VGDTGSWTGLGGDPTVSGASAIGFTKVRVSFSEPMESNAALVLAGNYTITEDVGSAARTVLSVAAEAVSNPNYVDLTLDGEMTIGTANYEVQVANVEDPGGNVIDPAGDSADFDGAGDRPSLVSVVSAEETITKVRVTFSEAVKQVSALNSDDALNPSNYGITGSSSVSVVSVASVSSSLVELTVSGQIAGGNYDLAVTSVEDLVGNAVASPMQLGYVVVSYSMPEIVFTPADGKTGFDVDGYATVTVKDSEDGFTGLDQDTWQVSVEFDVDVGGTPQAMTVDVIVDGQLTGYVEGEVTGDAMGYSGIMARFRLVGGWPESTLITMSAEVEDVDGRFASDESEFTTDEVAVCDLSYMWKPTVPEQARREDEENQDSVLKKFVDTMRASFEWICGKTAEFPEQIRDPLVCRTRENENITVELLSATVGDDIVTVTLGGDIDEVSGMRENVENDVAAWILDDGSSEFKVKAVRKYIPGVQDPAEIDIKGTVAPVIGAGKTLRPQSLLPLLAKDFGLTIDESESEGRQRSTLFNAVQWLDMKGSEKSYVVRGLISGFIVEVLALYQIPESMTSTIPGGKWWRIGDEYFTAFAPAMPRFDEIEGDAGLLDEFCWEDTDDFRFVKEVATVAADGDGWKITFAAGVTDLKPMQIEGNWKVIDSRDDVEVVGAGDGVEQTFETTADKPPLAPGTVSIEYTSGGLTKTITDDGFGGLEGDVSPAGQNKVDYDTGEMEFMCPVAPDNATDLELTYNREFWVEEFDDTLKTVNVGPYDDQPEIGASTDFYLRYACPEAMTCWFCKTAKLRVEITPGSILDDPGVDASTALVRMAQKLQDVVPAHVDLSYLVFRTFVEAGVDYGVDINSRPMVTVYAPMRDQFDGITGDE